MRKLLLVCTTLLLAGCEAPEGLPPPATAPSPSGPSVLSHAKPPLPQVKSAGPLTAAKLEAYMDANEALLRAALRGQGAVVARRGNDLVVVVPSDRLFDKTVVNDGGDNFLRALAPVLTRYDHTAIEVNCYTDGKGGEAQNLAVSQKRAKALASGLSGYGVTSARLGANGLGAANPRTADPNDLRNRRVEIKITPRPS